MKILTLLFLALLWGSSFMFMKKGLLAFSAYEVALLRIFISFLALSPILIIRYKEIRAKHFGAALLVGVFGSGIPPFLFSIAQTKIDSSTAGIINSLTPLFTLLLGALLFKVLFDKSRIAGIILGLSGAVLIIGLGSNTLSGIPIIYLLMPAFAALFYGFSANILKYRLFELRSLTLTAYIFLIIGPLAGISLFFTDFSTNLMNHPDATESFIYILLLGIGSNALGVVLFNRLIQQTDALFASTVTYLIPIVALFWGFLDGELMGWQELTGLALILGGVYLSSKFKKKPIPPQTV